MRAALRPRAISELRPHEPHPLVRYRRCFYNIGKCLRDRGFELAAIRNSEVARYSGAEYVLVHPRWSVIRRSAIGRVRYRRFHYQKHMSENWTVIRPGKIEGRPGQGSLQRNLTTSTPAGVCEIASENIPGARPPALQSSSFLSAYIVCCRG